MANELVGILPHLLAPQNVFSLPKSFAHLPQLFVPAPAVCRTVILEEDRSYAVCMEAPRLGDGGNDFHLVACPQHSKTVENDGEEQSSSRPYSVFPPYASPSICPSWSHRSLCRHSSTAVPPSLTLAPSPRCPVHSRHRVIQTASTLDHDICHAFSEIGPYG